MRERRYKYTVWGGPLRQAQGPGFLSVRSVSLPNWPLSSRRGKISFNISLGARPKGSNGGVAVGLPHRNSSVFKQTPYQSMESKRKNKNGTPPSEVTKAAAAMKPGLAKRRALFPEGRGLGVGGRKRDKRAKEKVIEQTKATKIRSCNRGQIFGVVLVEYKRLALQRH